jgi:cation diffusion facilitator family transporter
MPDPQPHPDSPNIKRVAWHALVAGIAIMLFKFAIFGMTNSAAVLSDALESIVNLVAASMMMYSIWLSNRPADADHPYGHGKIEFLAIGLEGCLILSAGVMIVYESVRRLIWPPTLNLERFSLSTLLLAGVALLSALLAAYVWLSGRKFNNANLVADGKHLATDALSTLGGVASLALVHRTGKVWIDPLIAIATAGIIFFISWKLLWQSAHGLMDRSDPHDEAVIKRILDEEVAAGAIRAYHKVRHRHTGAFHWVDMHLQVPAELSIREGHELASRIEFRIEQELSPGNATAHIEPFDPPSLAEAPPGPASGPPAG